MAKIAGPLYSVSASGTIGSKITFRATTHGLRAQRPPVPTAPPSAPQINERARFAAALTAWNTLSLESRAEWTTFAVTKNRAPHVAFTAEYLVQQCVAPALPLVPATTFEEP